ncbi:MAG: hypothetical protein QW270_04480 [Candidatus Bathyarchaeia archaeon]
MKKWKITVLTLCCLMATFSLNIYKAKTEGKTVVTEVFEGSIFDGFIVRAGTNYTDVWSSTSGNAVVDEIETIVIGQHKSGDNYVVYRGFVIFDTITIPDMANVTAATLSLCVASVPSQVNFNITIQKSAVTVNGQPEYPHIPLILEDYNNNQYTGNCGSRSIQDGFTINEYWNITLNAEGVNWINKVDWTRFCLRSSREIVGIQLEQDEYVVFCSAEHIPPKLYVTYEISKQEVGGIILPTDKLSLLVSYIAATVISCVTIITIAHIKRAKRENTL